MPRVQFEKIVKSYGRVTVLKNLDLEVEDGEFVVLLGPSGCGKTTLLNLLAGLIDVSSGRISIGGKDVTDLDPKDRGLAMVFQSYALYPTKTVRGNLKFGLAAAKLDRAEQERRIQWAAKLLQIEPLLDRKPAQLSGGQRQRVAIGRAIVREPVAFLFDEPLSNLDAALRVEMRIEIAKLHQRLKATMVYVTHDQVEAMTLADKIVVLDRGDIQQVGTPMELYEHPANLFVAQFIGSPKMNVMPARSGGKSILIGKGGHIDFAATVPVGVTGLGARPEEITLVGEAAGDVRGTIDVVERLGSDTFAYVAVEDLGILTVRIVGNVAAMAVGQPVGLKFDPARLHLFGTDGKTIQL
jgi:multiple sugar transport system ATP-binding protein